MTFQFIVTAESYFCIYFQEFRIHSGNLKLQGVLKTEVRLEGMNSRLDPSINYFKKVHGLLGTQISFMISLPNTVISLL